MRLLECDKEDLVDYITGLETENNELRKLLGHIYHVCGPWTVPRSRFFNRNLVVKR